MADDMLLGHVADIVSAQVGNNSVAANDLPGPIQAVYVSLAALGQAPVPIEEPGRSPKAKGKVSS